MNLKYCRFIQLNLWKLKIQIQYAKKEKLLFSKCQGMSGLDPEFGIKMMEMKVAEMSVRKKLMRLKLTRIFTIGVNLMER